ncbi:YPR097W [Zygosaccharomyces parabailii]|nr:YPR097W [Zygosaccharomyces parabailii]
MSIILTPTQEHYLKRELLKAQLNHEFTALNDQYALRKFGFPFSPDDPTKDGISRKKRLLRHMIPPLGDSSHGQKDDDEAAVDNYMHSDTQFPMLSYVLEEIIMPFPLLSRELAMDEEFWQKKVQVFYEHFESLGFSESYDREEFTKRKRISKKLNKAILLLFNSGIGASQEREYYEHDKFKLQDDSIKKATKAGEISMPTKENLRNYVTNEPVFINGWDVNVVAVAPEAVVFNRPDSPKKSRPTPTSPTKEKGSYYSKWMKPKFSMQPSSLLSKLSLTDTSVKPSKLDAYFLIRIKRKSDPRKIIFVAKNYEDFKKLAHQLKSEFPGKKLANVPHKTKKSISVVTTLDTQSSPVSGKTPSTPKEKIVASMPLDSPQTTSASVFSNADSDASSIADDASTDDWDFDEFQDASDAKSNRLVGERMRTSLRQYLRSLCGDEEVSQSLNLCHFFTKKPLAKESFNKELLQDIKHRELVDISNLETQVRFQKLALKRSIELQDAMKELKTSLLKDENYLLSLVGELKVKTKVSELSPLLRSFVEWCKVYLSSTIYQVFLGNDSGYEFYTQIKRLHKLMPYTMMAQIMRFTNPMGMMKAMIDLFMAQPFGGQSLLQTMFSTILADDLKGQEKVTHELEQKALHDASGALDVIECLKKSVFKNDRGQIIDMKRVHEESDSMGMPACLVILLKHAENGAIAATAVDDVIESYTAWKSLKKTPVDKIKPQQEADAAYFTRVKELLQLYVRERDKILMKKLWQDPELSQLLRSIVTLVYEPMVRIFKVARVDIALKNFERFMNDLIKLIDEIYNGQQGVSSQFNVVDSINNLFTKHQDACLTFIHEVYVHDTEGIFEGFITWIVRIVRILQKSAYGGPEERIDFSQMLQKSNVDINLLRQQVDDVIQKKQEARATYSKLLDVKIRKEEQSLSKNTGKALETKWKQMNALVLPTNGDTIGLGDGELVDLDLDASDYENLKHEDDVELEKKYKRILEREVDVSEIEKFGNEVFESKLKSLLFQNAL